VFATDGRAVSEPYYSQRARSVCVSLGAFFINIIDTVVTGMDRERERERERERDGAEVTLGGNALHARAPATGNAVVK